MNRLNPIYLLALVITLFVVSISMETSKENEYKELNSSVNSLNLKAQSFKEYKNSWFNKKRVESKINSILRNSVFKKEKVLKVQNKNIIKIKMESNNPRVLEKFLNKVLNENFLIKKLNIEKRSILVEIGFK